MLRPVSFIDKAKPHDAPALHDQFRGGSVRPQVQVWNLMCPREKRPADLSARRVAVRVQYPGTAVRGFACKGQLRSRAVEFRAPFDELCDVLRAFFHYKSYRISAA